MTTEQQARELLCSLNLAAIIAAIDKDIVPRKLISDIWAAQHPEHNIRDGDRRRGTVRRRFIKVGVMCLERRGILKREGENDLRILDMPAIKRMILRRELPPVQSVSE